MSREPPRIEREPTPEERQKFLAEAAKATAEAEKATAEARVASAEAQKLESELAVVKIAQRKAERTEREEQTALRYFHLDEVMELVWTSATQLKQIQMNGDMIEKFRADIADSRKRLFAERTKMFEQISLTLEAIERTQQIEAKLQNMFISQQQGTRQ